MHKTAYLKLVMSAWAAVHQGLWGTTHICLLNALFNKVIFSKICCFIFSSQLSIFSSSVTSELLKNKIMQVPLIGVSSMIRTHPVTFKTEVRIKMGEQRSTYCQV